MRMAYCPFRYFDWEDAAGVDVAGLADRFLERFATIADDGHGTDPEYGAWYQEMLRLTSPDSLPIVYADWPLPEDHITTVGRAEVTIPLPPAPPLGNAAS